MSATATTSQTPEDGLDVYRVRDDLAQSFNPANSVERMLITQLAQSWLRLRDAYEVERRYRAQNDMLQVITTKLAEFKAVTGYVRDCERAWHRAMETLQKMQRQRRRENLSSPNARRSYDRLPLPPTSSTPPSATVPVVAPRRE